MISSSKRPARWQRSTALLVAATAQDRNAIARTSRGIITSPFLCSPEVYGITRFSSIEATPYSRPMVGHRRTRSGDETPRRKKGATTWITASEKCLPRAQNKKSPRLRPRERTWQAKKAAPAGGGPPRPARKLLGPLWRPLTRRGNRMELPRFPNRRSTPHQPSYSPRQCSFSNRSSKDCRTCAARG